MKGSPSKKPSRQERRKKQRNAQKNISDQEEILSPPSLISAKLDQIRSDRYIKEDTQEKLSDIQKALKEWVSQNENITTKEVIERREEINALLLEIDVINVQVNFLELRNLTLEKISQQEITHVHLDKALEICDKILNISNLFTILYFAKNIYELQNDLTKLDRVNSLITKYNADYLKGAFKDVSSEVFYYIELYGVFRDNENETKHKIEAYKKIYKECIYLETIDKELPSEDDPDETISYFLKKPYFTLQKGYIDFIPTPTIMIAWDLLVHQKLFVVSSIDERMKDLRNEGRFNLWFNKSNDHLYFIINVLEYVHEKVQHSHEKMFDYKSFYSTVNTTLERCVTAVNISKASLTPLIRYFNKNKSFPLLENYTWANYLITSYEYFFKKCLTFKKILNTTLNFHNQNFSKLYLSPLSQASDRDFKKFENECINFLSPEKCYHLKFNILYEAVVRENEQKEQQEQQSLNEANFLKELDAENEAKQKAKEGGAQQEQLSSESQGEEPIVCEEKIVTADEEFEKGNSAFEKKLWHSALAKFFKTRDKLFNSPEIDIFKLAFCETMISKSCLELSLEDKSFEDKKNNLTVAEDAATEAIQLLNNCLPSEEVSTLIKESYELIVKSLYNYGVFAMNDANAGLKALAKDAYDKAYEFFPKISLISQAKILSAYGDWYFLQSKDIKTDVITAYPQVKSLLEDSINKNKEALSLVNCLNGEENLKVHYKSDLGTLIESINMVLTQVSSTITNLEKTINEEFQKLKNERKAKKAEKEKWRSNDPFQPSAKAVKYREVKKLWNDINNLAENSAYVLDQGKEQYKLWQDKIAQAEASQQVSTI